MRTKKTGLILFVIEIKVSGRFSSFYISIKINNIWILLCIKLLHFNVFVTKSNFLSHFSSRYVRVFKKKVLFYLLCLGWQILFFFHFHAFSQYSKTPYIALILPFWLTPASLAIVFCKWRGFSLKNSIIFLRHSFWVPIFKKLILLLQWHLACGFWNR